MKRKKPTHDNLHHQLTLQQWFVPTNDNNNRRHKGSTCIQTHQENLEETSCVVAELEKTETSTQGPVQSPNVETVKAEESLVNNETNNENDIFQQPLEGKGFPFLTIASTLDTLQATSSRLSATEILSDLFLAILLKQPQDLLPAVYLCTNRKFHVFLDWSTSILKTSFCFL